MQSNYGRLSPGVDRRTPTGKTIATLDHVAVRCTDRERAARQFAALLGVEPSAPFGPWTPVAVSPALSLLFHDSGPFVVGHLAFRVDARALAEVVANAVEAGLAFGSAPGPDKDGRVSHEGAERRVYVCDDDGNSYEFMTTGAGSHHAERPATSPASARAEPTERAHEGKRS